MSFLKKWDLGAKGLAVCGIVADLARQIDPKIVLKVLMKIIEIEINPEYDGSGQGPRKVKALTDWFSAEYPGGYEYVDSLRAFAAVVVALMHAIKLFRK